MSQNDSPIEETLSLSALSHIEELSAKFASEWKAGGRPLIEVRLRQALPSERPFLLRKLLQIELQCRSGRGETPTAKEFEARFPEDVVVVANAFGLPSSTWKSPQLPTGVSEVCAEKPSRPVPGRRIGRYVIQRILGCGSFAEVYLARDEELGRQVAIKSPRRDRLTPETADKFWQEARTVAHLKQSLIVPVYDIGHEDDGLPFAVMEYIDGKSLQELLRTQRPSASRAAELVAQMAEAVHYAHRQGFVHRDLKPSNILLDASGNPHVADFGLALHESAQRERAGEYAGTVAYMAPEQIRRESHRLDGRTDVWALGVMLYEMLTGRRPFDGKDLAQVEDEILNREPKPPRQIDEKIPKELERVCLKCLSKDVTQRYSTAADLAQRLKDAIQPRRRLSHRVLGSLLALAICMVGVWGFWPAAKSPLPALEGTLDLLIWNPEDSTRRGLSLKDPTALPLRANDQIRIQVALNHPAFLYVVWIDSRGKAAPVYPWKPGHWEQWPESEEPTSRLSLPTAEDRGWKMEGPSGMETLMLLARERPLPREVALKEYFAQLPPTTLPNPRALLCFAQGRPVSRAMDPERGPDFFDTEHIGDPVLTTQRLIQERLSQYFPLIRAVSVASVGEEKKP
jgi:serine/threonine protein kinase